MNNKILGSTLLVIGTTIGAGMLALPMVSARSGFISASIALIAIWAIMTISGLFILEVNLAFPEYRNSLGTMAGTILGCPGKVLMWVCTLLILYALTAAYVAGSASLLESMFMQYFQIKVPNWINVVIYVLVMGGLVFWSTRAVDYCNRIFLSLKGICLVIVLILILPHVNIAMLITDSHLHSPKYLWAILPILITSFGFHTVIPSITNYVGAKARELKIIIWVGTVTALLVYLFWLFASLGVVPLSGQYGFTELAKNHNSVGKLMENVSALLQNKYITTFINGFANFAMTTSFLGVTLSLFDFLADGFNRPNTHYGRAQTAALTFVPPVIFTLFFPEGFVLALKYSGFFITILLIILPGLMVYKLRKSNALKSSYRVFGGNVTIGLVLLAGVFLIVVGMLALINVLPGG